MDDLIILVFYEIDNFCKEFIHGKRTILCLFQAKKICYIV